eukprot:547291-Alexandrium_andersonii.AAC.1
MAPRGRAGVRGTAAGRGRLLATAGHGPSAHEARPLPRLLRPGRTPDHGSRDPYALGRPHGASAGDA